MTVASTNLASSLATRRGAAALGLLGIGAALAIATLSNPDIEKSLGGGVGQAVRNIAAQGAAGIKTVASMFEDRSPGLRLNGVLANLKHKSYPVLHERALPKVRRPIAAPIIPPNAPPPASTPLYGLVAGAPPLLIPPGVVVPAGFLTPSGPPIFAPIAPPGGGGGGIIVSPGTVPEVPVTPPLTSGVPEPSSWLMMLVGFVAMAWTLRRNKVIAPEPPGR